MHYSHFGGYFKILSPPTWSAIERLNLTLKFNIQHLMTPIWLVLKQFSTLIILLLAVGSAQSLRRLPILPLVSRSLLGASKRMNLTLKFNMQHLKTLIVGFRREAKSLSTLIIPFRQAVALKACVVNQSYCQAVGARWAPLNLHIAYWIWPSNSICNTSRP